MNRSKKLAEIRLATTPALDGLLKQVNQFGYNCPENLLKDLHNEITNTDDDTKAEEAVRKFIKEAKFHYETEDSLGKVQVNSYSHDGKTEYKLNGFIGDYYKDGTIRDNNGIRRKLKNGSVEWEKIDFQHKHTSSDLRT